MKQCNCIVNDPVLMKLMSLTLKLALPRNPSESPSLRPETPFLKEFPIVKPDGADGPDGT